MDYSDLTDEAKQTLSCININMERILMGEGEKFLGQGFNVMFEPNLEINEDIIGELREYFTTKYKDAFGAPANVGLVNTMHSPIILGDPRKSGLSFSIDPSSPDDYLADLNSIDILSSQYDAIVEQIEPEMIGRARAFENVLREDGAYFGNIDFGSASDGGAKCSPAFVENEQNNQPSSGQPGTSFA